ncbi:MAG: hypothetical protein HRU19_01475 [Pseudobacteriovorax sp.]|nr:hypothetical protein [Pseudobacteriovorax sp.]
MKTIAHILFGLGLALPNVASAMDNQSPISDSPPSNGSGDGNNGSIGTPFPDMHRNNRAIAFASAILAGSGDLVEDWKAIRYYPGYSCYPSEPEQPIPLPPPSVPGGNPGNESGQADDPAPPSEEDSPSDPADPVDPVDPIDPVDPPNSACYGDVLFTKTYQLVECADGRAYIVRSGTGVSLSSPTSGQIYEWGEGVACGPFIRSRKELPSGALQFQGPILESNIEKDYQ